jgi:hypothetical protein
MRIKDLSLDSKFYLDGKLHRKCSEIFICPYTEGKGGIVKLGRNTSIDPKTRVRAAQN